MSWAWTRFRIQMNVPGKNVVEMVGDTMANHNPDPTRTAIYAGIDGLAGLLAYTGMAYAPNCGPLGSLAITGGGHAAYAGNEVYVFDFSRQLWSRINDPSTKGLTRGAIYLADHYGEYPDGKPSANHTYSSLVAIPGGVNGKGLLLEPSKPALPWVGSNNSAWAHVCDLGTGVWSRYSTNEGPHVNPAGALSGQVLNVCCYDASRNCVWGLPRGLHSALTKLDLATRTFIPQPFAPSNLGYNPTCPQHPVDDHMLVLTGIGGYGDLNKCTLGAIDLNNTAAGMKVLSFASNTDFPPDAVLTSYGFDWDTHQGCGYLFPGNWNYDEDPRAPQRDMNHVYRVTKPISGALTTGLWQMTKITLPQSLPLSKSDGTYSRWRYVPSIKKFAYLARENQQLALWTPL